MLLRLMLTEGAFSFCALAFGHAFLLLTEVLGPKTNFLLRLRRSILGAENLGHRMNDATSEKLP